MPRHAGPGWRPRAVFTPGLMLALALLACFPFLAKLLLELAKKAFRSRDTLNPD
jgi:hypothetical protein